MRSTNANAAKVWMPLYVGDYLADTGRLTTEQHGAYLLLIFDYWRNGAPPDDDSILATVCRLSANAWSMHSPVLRRFFIKAEDGLLHHKRIDAEIAKAQINREASVKRAKKGAEARSTWFNGERYDDENRPTLCPVVSQPRYVNPAEAYSGAEYTTEVA